MLWPRAQGFQHVGSQWPEKCPLCARYLLVFFDSCMWFDAKEQLRQVRGLATTTCRSRARFSRARFSRLVRPRLRRYEWLCGLVVAGRQAAGRGAARDAPQAGAELHGRAAGGVCARKAPEPPVRRGRPHASHPRARRTSCSSGTSLSPGRPTRRLRVGVFTAGSSCRRIIP